MLTKGLLHYTIIKHIIDEGFAPDLKTLVVAVRTSIPQK